MGQAQHGRRCSCGECAAFRGAEATAAALRSSYEAALDHVQRLVAATPELKRDEPVVRAAQAFLAEAGRTVR